MNKIKKICSIFWIGHAANGQLIFLPRKFVSCTIAYHFRSVFVSTFQLDIKNTLRNHDDIQLPLSFPPCFLMTKYYIDKSIYFLPEIVS